MAAYSDHSSESDHSFNSDCFYDSGSDNCSDCEFPSEGENYSELEQIFIDDDLEGLDRVLQEMPPEEIYRILDEKCFVVVNRYEYCYAQREPLETINCFKRLIKKGLDINFRGWNGRTPLHVILSYNIDYFSYALKKGGNINAKDCDGMTPIHLYFLNASRNEKHYDLDILKKAAERGFDFKSVNDQGETCLHCCSRYGVEYFLPVLDLFIRNGLDINAKDEDGDTFLASSYLNYSRMKGMIPVLLDRGFDFHTKNGRGLYVWEVRLDTPQNASKIKNRIEKLEAERFNVKEPEFD